MHFSTNQLATALNLTPQRINQLIVAGVLPKPKKGRHDPFTAVPAYLQFLERRLTGGDLKSARIQKYTVETSIKELELRERSGDLVSRRAAEHLLFTIARTVRDNLANVKSRIADLVAVEKNRDRCYEIIDREINQCLEALATANIDEVVAGNGQAGDMDDVPIPNNLRLDV